jgi:hypothetical protein
MTLDPCQRLALNNRISLGYGLTRTAPLVLADRSVAGQ